MEIVFIDVYHFFFGGLYEIPIFQNWNKIRIKLEIDLNKKLKFRNKIGIYSIPIQFQFFKK